MKLLGRPVKSWTMSSMNAKLAAQRRKNVLILGPRNEEIMRESRLCSPDAGAHFSYVTVVMTDETQQSHDWPLSPSLSLSLFLSLPLNLPFTPYSSPSFPTKQQSLGWSFHPCRGIGDSWRFGNVERKRHSCGVWRVSVMLQSWTEGSQDKTQDSVKLRSFQLDFIWRDRGEEKGDNMNLCDVISLLAELV